MCRLVELVGLCFLFFFLMILRPPRSTLFPTRRSSDLLEAGLARLAQHLGVDPRTPGAGAAGGTAFGLLAWGGRVESGAATRSEEDTSELQSHVKIVCRLLLEKKKKEKSHSTERSHTNC